MVTIQTYLVLLSLFDNSAESVNKQSFSTCAFANLPAEYQIYCIVGRQHLCHVWPFLVAHQTLHTWSSSTNNNVVFVLKIIPNYQRYTRTCNCYPFDSFSTSLYMTFRKYLLQKFTNLTIFFEFARRLEGRDQSPSRNKLANTTFSVENLAVLFL